MKTRSESMRYETIHYQEEGSSQQPSRPRPGTIGLLKMTPGHPAYPPRLGPTGPALYARGAVGLLAHRLVAVFASIKTPGSAILRALDWARSLDIGNSVVIGGFHSPLEQECLSLLLKRAVPVIAFPAREIARYRLPTEWQVAIDAERRTSGPPNSRGCSFSDR